MHEYCHDETKSVQRSTTYLNMKVYRLYRTSVCVLLVQKLNIINIRNNSNLPLHSKEQALFFILFFMLLYI